MTTTERQRPISAGSGGGGNHLKLYLTSLLAAAYIAAWFGVQAPAKADTETWPPGATPDTNEQSATTTWFHDLSAAERPVVDLPVGWHIADQTTSAPTIAARVAPVPVRVAPRRAGRVRTRSS